MCQVVVRLLHEARNSAIKSSASDLHHYSLEVTTLGLLSRNTKRESQANIREEVCTLTSEKDTLNTNLSVEDRFHLRHKINNRLSEQLQRNTEETFKTTKNAFISDKDTLDESKRHLKQLETLKRQHRDAKQSQNDIKSNGTTTKRCTTKTN